MKFKYKKLAVVIFSTICLFVVFNGATCQESIVKSIVGENPESANKEQVTKAVTNLADILAGAASTIALIFIIVGGIQYITSAGNQEQAQKAKSTLTWAVIGFILIIASYGIVRYFMTFVKEGTLPS